MKKVIGAVLAGTMVAGMAFADPKITLNFRVRPTLYDQTSVYATAKSDSATKQTSTLNFAGYGGDTDCFTIGISTDYAGVFLDTDYGTSTTGGNAWYSTSTATSDTTAKIDAYYGWLNFGALKLTAGKVDTRVSNKMTSGATNLNLTDKEGYKMGVWTNLAGAGTTTLNADKPSYVSKGSLGYDSDNLTALSSSKKTSLLGEYGIKDVGNGTLMLRAAIVDNNYKTDTSDTSGDYKYQYAGYAFNVGYKADAFDIEGVAKMPESDVFVGAAFAEIKAVKNLDAVLGFTFVNDSFDNKDYTTAYHTTKTSNYKHTEMAFDARATYAINDKAKVIGHFNYSMFKPDNATNAWSTSKTDAESGMYIVGDFSYIVNDLITGECSAGYYATDLDDNDKANRGENYFVINPAVMLTAGKGAFVSVGLRYQQAVNTGDVKDLSTAYYATKSEISIPMVFRVKM